MSPPRSYRISVVINSFNRADFVGEAIESVIQQTRTADQIIVSDVSTDNSRQIIEGYASRNTRIHAKYAVNRGQLATILGGLAIADGDLVFLLDGDDRYKPRHLELIENRWRDYPAADLIYCRNELFGDETVELLKSRYNHESGHWLGPIDLESPYDWAFASALSWCLPDYHIGNVTSCLSFKRDHLENLPLRKLCRDNAGMLTAHADYIILLASALHAGRKIYVPERTVEYRAHARSVTGLAESGCAAAMYKQKHTCCIARNWLCHQQQFARSMRDLLDAEMQAVPCISEGHARMYAAAKAMTCADTTTTTHYSQRIEDETKRQGSLESQNSLADAQKQLATMRASTCWRATAPMRWLGDLLRRRKA